MYRSSSCLLATLMLISDPVASEPLGFGESLRRSQCETNNTYEFASVADDVVVAHMTECHDFGGDCGRAAFNFDPCLEIRDPLGGLVAQACSEPRDNNTYRGARVRIGPQILDASGEGVLQTYDNGGGAGGETTVSMQSVINPQGARLLSTAAPLVGNITNCGQLDTFQVQAEAGQRVILTAAPGAESAVLPRLELYDPAGALLIDQPAAELDVVVAATGSYTLLAYSAIGELGTYNLSLRLDVPPNCPPVGDVDGDCAITPADALCLFRAYLEQPSCLD